MADPLSALAKLVFDEIELSERTQADIAWEVGITEKHLSQLKHGKVGMSVAIAERLLCAVERRLVFGTAPIMESPGAPRG